MSRMLRRPPAKEISWPRLEGPSDLQHYAAVDSAKNFGGPSVAAYGGAVEELKRRIAYIWQDLLQINPAHEQPKLILYSAAQPFIRTGHMRRMSRTYMTASSPFLGRWAYVGAQQRQFVDRTRMTGVPMRTGVTYRVPRFRVAPRAIQLGPGGPD